MALLKRLLSVCCVIAICIVLWGLLIFNRNKGNSGEIFAESIKVVNVPRNICVYKGNTLVLNKVPYKIEPENCNQVVTIEVLDSKFNNLPDAEFKDNSFRSDKIGSYYIKFSVLNKNKKKIYDYLKIDVKDEIVSESKAILIENKLVYVFDSDNVDFGVNIIKGVNDVVTVDKSYLSLSESDIENNVLNRYRLRYSITGEYYTIIDELEVVEYNVSASYIVVRNQENIDIEQGETIYVSTDELTIVFTVDLVGSKIKNFDCEISDDSVLEILSSDAPILILRIVSAGRCEVKISDLLKTHTFSFNIIVTNQ